jgi:hypothetical protein
MSRPLRSTLLLATLFTTSLCYTWPSPKLDALESARFDQTGWRSLSLANGVVPCSAFTHPTGSTDGIRSNAGDWIRTVCITIWLNRIQVVTSFFRHIMIWLRIMLKMALVASTVLFGSQQNRLAARCVSKLGVDYDIQILFFFDTECWRWLP